MGHVPAGPLPEEGTGHDLPRRQRRRGRAPRVAAARLHLGRRSIGALGERIAERFLVARGARVVARNLRLWPGEIDLLVEINGVLAAVEVKTRVGADPAEELTDLKTEALLRSGGRMGRPPQRYDLIAVRLGSAGAEVRWLPAVC